jgi:hypothetical protein
MSNQAPYGDVTYTPPNSSMAIVSLVAGILGLTIFPLIGSIVALITGSMAKKEIRESRGALGGVGLAKAGVILGWIGIALSILGLCLFFILVLLPFLLIALGLSTQNSGSVLPALIVFL